MAGATVNGPGLPGSSTPGAATAGPLVPGLKTVVVFQGGGALGAFGAGAWSALTRQPGFRREDVVALAGASIGALNAALVAHHLDEPDHGAATLQALWTDRLATPPWPFFGVLPMPLPPSAADTGQWNGFLTAVLMGVRGMSAAAWPTWQPMAGMGRLRWPLHNRQVLWDWLERELALYDTAGDTARPLLAAPAVDILSGELTLFDSDRAPLTARHLAASSAMPLLFDPVTLDERLYWDGEATRDSLLPLLLQRLLDTGRVRAGEPLQLITLEPFPRAMAAPPQSGVEMVYRVLSLQQLDKLVPPAMAGIHVAKWQRFVREPLPEDGVSGQLDFSPRRIARVLEQGREAVEGPAPEPTPTLSAHPTLQPQTETVATDA